MVGSMIVETSTLGPVTNYWVYSNCPITIYGKSFGMDLLCLPLRSLDVICGMNWLEFNCVHINYYKKTVSFPEVVCAAKKVDELVKDEANVFMLLASMKDGNKVAICDLLVVCDFLKVFPDDINSFPQEHQVMFDIDLVPSTSPVSMDHYRISSSKLS